MTKNVFKPTSQNIEKAADVIRNGGLVAFPTETVYGLGGMATNPSAVARIFEVKKRPFFDPLIVHVHSKLQLEEVVINIPDRALDLIERFWPGPLTIVLEKSDTIPDIVTSGLNTVAVRMPDHPVAKELIEKAGVPITAPSANPFSYLSPTTADHVESQLGLSVDMILDGGICPVGVESTIIRVTDESLALLRPGGLSVDLLEEIYGEGLEFLGDVKQPEAPGQLPYHYSPNARLAIVESIENIDFNKEDCAFLLFTDSDKLYPVERTRLLSKNGDMREAASNLFSALHELDEMDVSLIIAQAVPEQGLGLAIMDRLKKASQKTFSGDDNAL